MFRFQDVWLERFVVKLKQGNRESNSLNFVSPKPVFYEEILGTEVLLLDTRDTLAGQGTVYERKKYSKGRMNIGKDTA